MHNMYELCEIFAFESIYFLWDFKENFWTLWHFLQKLLKKVAILILLIYWKYLAPTVWHTRPFFFSTYPTTQAASQAIIFKIIIAFCLWRVVCQRSNSPELSAYSEQRYESKEHFSCSLDQLSVGLHSCMSNDVWINRKTWVKQTNMLSLRLREIECSFL